MVLRWWWQVWIKPTAIVNCDAIFIFLLKSFYVSKIVIHFWNVMFKTVILKVQLFPHCFLVHCLWLLYFIWPSEHSKHDFKCKDCNLQTFFFMSCHFMACVFVNINWPNNQGDNHITADSWRNPKIGCDFNWNI